jgi:outer membrane protein OmpA-like peptidoglycan-associated protein
LGKDAFVSKQNLIAAGVKAAIALDITALKRRPKVVEEQYYEEEYYEETAQDTIIEEVRDSVISVQDTIVQEAPAPQPEPQVIKHEEPAPQPEPQPAPIPVKYDEPSPKPAPQAIKVVKPAPQPTEQPESMPQRPVRQPQTKPRPLQPSTMIPHKGVRYVDQLDLLMNMDYTKDTAAANAFYRIQPVQVIPIAPGETYQAPTLRFYNTPAIAPTPQPAMTPEAKAAPTSQPAIHAAASPSAAATGSKDAYSPNFSQYVNSLPAQQRGLTQSEQIAAIISHATDSIMAAGSVSAADMQQDMAGRLLALEEPVSGYALNATTLSKAQKADIDKKIALLLQYPNLRIIIEGHTCDLGTPFVNYRIAMQRAKEVRKYLMSKGIDSRRIIAIESKGEEMPLAPNNNVKNRMLNRRIIMRIAQ